MDQWRKYDYPAYSFLVWCCGIIVGAAGTALYVVCSWSNFENGFYLICLFVIMSAFCAIVQKNVPLRMLSLFVLGIVISFINYHSHFCKQPFLIYYGRSIDWIGKIVDDPLQFSSGQKVIIQPDGHPEFIAAIVYGQAELNYGNKIWVRGSIADPKVKPGNKYNFFDKSNNIYAQLENPKLIVLGQGGNAVYKNILKLRKYFIAKVATTIADKDQQSLILGVWLGKQIPLSIEAADDFRFSGLAHVVAVSGYNISLLGLVILKLFRQRQKSKIVFLFSILLIVLYGLIAGFSASVTRAIVMFSLSLLATQAKRPYSLDLAFWTAAAVMILHNPLMAAWDIGFQLSFAATAGIIWMMPILDKCRFKYAIFDYLLNEPILVTCSAVIMTMPIIAWHFETISFMGPFANLFVIPAIPLLMASALLVCLPIVGSFFGLIASFISSYIFGVAHMFGSGYGSNIIVDRLWFVSGFSLMAGLILWILATRVKN